MSVTLSLSQSMDSIHQTKQKSRLQIQLGFHKKSSSKFFQVKTLLRFRCVCNSWKSLISDPYFVRKHLVQTSSMGCPSRYQLLFTNRKVTRLEAVSLDPLVGSTDYESIAKPRRSTLQLDETPLQKLQPVGSCNGLILLLDRDSGMLLLWNPSIRQSKILPDGGLQTPHRMSHAFHFGYHSLSNDDIVVEVAKKRRVNLYSLRENSWKRIADSPHKLHGSSACYGNFFIWEIDILKKESRKIFLSFDLVKESFQEHPLPAYEKRWHYMLGELYADVCAVYDVNTYIDVWVMKEFGAEESWLKILTCSAPLINHYRPLSTWGDEFVLVGQYGVAICNKKIGPNRVIEFEDSWTYQAQMHVENLVSPSGE